MRNKLLKLWSLQNTTVLKHLRLNHFLLSNIESSERLRILTACPWHLDNFPLLTRTWIANFSPSNSTRYASIWISIPHLPIDYIRPDILKLIGNALGKIIAFDRNNLDKSLLSVTRLCVEIDISRSLPPSIIFNGIQIPLIYENLSFYKSHLFETLLPLLASPPMNPFSSSQQSEPSIFPPISVKQTFKTFSPSKKLKNTSSQNHSIISKTLPSTG